jgi:flagellar biosynthetic protein FliP
VAVAEASQPASSLALTQGLPPTIELEVPNVGTVSAPLQILILLTFLTFIPAVLVTMTAFTRIVIVFHFLRQALGTQEMPSNQILLGLALFITMFVMAPVGIEVNTNALQPVVAGEIGLGEAIGRAIPPVRGFMLMHTRENDLSLFTELSGTEPVSTVDELPMQVVIPAFVISELKTGFQMGFFLFVPFLLIDLVVSTTLLSMGMMQLPPMMISLPFKVMLFVMIDGWNLLVGSVVRSFL